jgi:hypothetical protein
MVNNILVGIRQISYWVETLFSNGYQESKGTWTNDRIMPLLFDFSNLSVRAPCSLLSVSTSVDTNTYRHIQGARGIWIANSESGESHNPSFDLTSGEVLLYYDELMNYVKRIGKKDTISGIWELENHLVAKGLKLEAHKFHPISFSTNLSKLKLKETKDSNNNC